MDNDSIRPVISDKIITVYKNGHGIHEVIEELQKGARELERREREQQRSEDATYENEKNTSMQISQKKETK